MKVCAICGKNYLKGNARSHSKRATIKRQHPNLQQITYLGKKVLACTKCVKTVTRKGQANKQN